MSTVIFIGLAILVVFNKKMSNGVFITLFTALKYFLNKFDVCIFNSYRNKSG